MRIVPHRIFVVNADLNPQAEQMADESMVRTYIAQHSALSRGARVVALALVSFALPALLVITLVALRVLVRMTLLALLPIYLARLLALLALLALLVARIRFGHGPRSGVGREA